MKLSCVLFLLSISNCTILRTKDSEDQERDLMIMMGNQILNPPLVCPPPPIFDTGRIPMMQVHNLINYPH